MEKKPFAGTMSQWWKKSLSDLKVKEGFPTVTELKYSGEYDHFNTIEEVRAVNEYPSDAQIVKFKNAQRKAAAKQKAMAAQVLAAGLIEPTTDNDPQLRLKRTFEMYMSNVPVEKREDAEVIKEAREASSKFLNIEWEDEDDE